MAEGQVRVLGTLQSIDTEYTADSTEWCPVEGHKEILACGTYQLLGGQETGQGVGQDDGQEKVGRLLLYELVGEDENMRLVETDRVDTGAILDAKWCPHTVGDLTIIGSVEVAGNTALFSLQEEGGKKRLQRLTSILNESPQVINLSLDWSTRLHSCPTPDIAVSSTDGSVTVYRLNGGSLVQLNRWLAHTSQWTTNAEAWICAYDCWNPSTLFTGGDEGRFKGWDLRTDCSRPLFVNKSHQMGVCSIQSNTNREHCLATGSYDDTVRLWDTRNMTEPFAEQNVGGGVWRIKWSTQQPSLLLTACIYNHFRILRADMDSSVLEEVCSYDEHTSLAYGADWRADPTDPTRTVGATCSFYDHSLKLWRAQI